MSGGGVGIPGDHGTVHRAADDPVQRIPGVMNRLGAFHGGHMPSGAVEAHGLTGEGDRVAAGVIGDGAGAARCGG